MKTAESGELEHGICPILKRVSHVSPHGQVLVCQKASAISPAHKTVQVLVLILIYTISHNTTGPQNLFLWVERSHPPLR